MPQQKYAICCFNNLDGICAAAIVARHLKLKNHSFRIFLLSYPTVEDDLAELAKLDGYYVFVLDVSPENVPYLEEKLTRISKANKIVYWNSHHPYSEESKKILEKHCFAVELSGMLKNSLVFEQRKCSAELVFQKFMKNDSISEKLANIAHDMEFWIRKDENAPKLADLIASGFDRKELIDIFSRGVIWSERFETLRSEYLEKKEKALKVLIERAKVKDYIRCKVGISKAPSSLSTADAGHEILDKLDVDMAVVIYRDGKISLRRKEGCEVDLADAARKLFHGGGHPYAAGGDIKEKYLSVNMENFEDVVLYIHMKLADYFI